MSLIKKNIWNCGLTVIFLKIKFFFYFFYFDILILKK